MSNEARLNELEQYVKNVREAGLTVEADALGNALWGFYRTLTSFDVAFPYLDDPEAAKEFKEGCAGKGTMHIVNYTLSHWSKELGIERKTEEEVRREQEADDHYHRTHTS